MATTANPLDPLDWTRLLTGATPLPGTSPDQTGLPDPWRTAPAAGDRTPGGYEASQAGGAGAPQGDPWSWPGLGDAMGAAARTVATAATGGNPGAFTTGPYAATGASWGDDGFHTQAGGVIPKLYGGAPVKTTITTRRGTSVDLPSMWDPARARYGGDILGTAQGKESVIGRIVRRLSDAEDAGQALTPDLIQNEIRRVLGEAMRETGTSDPGAFGLVQGAQLYASKAAPATGAPPAGGAAPTVVKTVKNPDGSLTEYYSDGTTKTSTTPGGAPGNGGTGTGGGKTSTGDGAPPATPPPAADPNASGSVGYNATMASDKAFRTAQLLQALGLGDPNRQHSYFGKSLVNTYTNLFDPWVSTQGLDPTAMPMDNWDALLKKFASEVQAPGGFAAIDADARAALGRLGGLSANLDDKDLIGLVDSWNQLRNYGRNPVIRQFNSNLVDDALGQYLARLGEAERAGGDQAGAGFRFLPYLQSDPRYRGLLGY